MKYYCIKDFKPVNRILFKKGIIYNIEEIDRDVTGNLYSEYMNEIMYYIKPVKARVGLKMLLEYFIPFSEWREERINKIFED
jgi:hypothetical protein